MTDIFIKVVEMSMTASIVIGVVMVLRIFLRKAPKVFSYVLWAAALFRLLCPISFEMPSAPIPSVEIPYSTDVNDRNADGLFITNNDVEIVPAPEYSEPQNLVSPQVTTVSEPVSEIPVKREINYIAIASYIWAFAVIIMAFRGIISWARLSHSLRSAQKMGGNVYVSSAISDPFIMGIIRPKIYLPTGLSCTESDLIIRHEKAHMHRGDHIAKLVMYGALCVHCFNPLVWLMFRLFERDMEMSCDEKVTADMTKEQKADYSQTLLKISAKPTAAFTVCFGENGTKQRIKNVLSFKKPAVWVVIVLAVAAVVISVVLCVSRENDGSSIPADALDKIDVVDSDDTFTSEKLKEFFSLGVNPNSVGLSINNSEGVTFSEPFIIPIYNTVNKSLSNAKNIWGSALFHDSKLIDIKKFTYKDGQAAYDGDISIPTELCDSIDKGDSFSIFLVETKRVSGYNNAEVIYAVDSNGECILIRDDRIEKSEEHFDGYPDFNSVCEYNCVSSKMEEAVTLEELNVLPDSPELTPALGMNGVLAYMKREDYYGKNNNEYTLHREIVTDGGYLDMYRERFRDEYGKQIDEYNFSVEYLLIPLYDETGENVVDYFRQDCRVTPILPEKEIPDSAEEAIEKFLDYKYGIVINSINENDYVYGDDACELLKKNFALDFSLPVDEKYSESALYYGGYEFKPEVNEKICSMNNGTVLFAGYKNGFGNTVLIDHGDNNIFLYANMNSISVSVNDSVKSGTVIGYAGDSGFTPHCRLLVYNICDPVNSEE